MGRAGRAGLTRAGFLRAGGLGLAGATLGSLGHRPGSARAAGAPAVTIGVISDEHLRADARAEITALDDQRRRYAAFVESMNRDVRPDFVVQLGDLPDGCGATCATIVDDEEAVRRIRLGREAIHHRLDMPVLDVMGNHEYRDPAWDREKILSAINPGWSRASDTWYRRSVKGFEFVFLNTAYTDTVTSAHSAPAEELEWLESTLADCRQPTFVFMHVPASAGGGGAYDQFAGQDEVKRLLAGHEHFVAAFFGHSHHADGWDRLRAQQDEYGNQHYHVTAPHQWMDDASQVPWAVIEIWRDRLRFATGAGVPDAGGWPTEWVQPYW